MLNWAYRTPAGGEQIDLFHSDPVEMNDVLSTVAEGQLEVTFDDGSILRVDKASSVTVDEFVYNGGADDKLHVNLGEGALRFITGQMQPQGIQIETPLGYLGVRGTDVLVVYDQRIVTMFVLAGKMLYAANPLLAYTFPPFVRPMGLQPDGTVVVGTGYKLILFRQADGSIGFQLLPITPADFLFAFNRLAFAAFAIGGQHLGPYFGPDGEAGGFTPGRLDRYSN